MKLPASRSVCAKPVFLVCCVAACTLSWMSVSAAEQDNKEATDGYCEISRLDRPDWTSNEHTVWKRLCLTAQHRNKESKSENGMLEEARKACQSSDEQPGHVSNDFVGEILSERAVADPIKRAGLVRLDGLVVTGKVVVPTPVRDGFEVRDTIFCDGADFRSKEIARVELENVVVLEKGKNDKHAPGDIRFSRGKFDYVRLQNVHARVIDLEKVRIKSDLHVWGAQFGHLTAFGATIEGQTSLETSTQRADYFTNRSGSDNPAYGSWTDLSRLRSNDNLRLDQTSFDGPLNLFGASAEALTARCSNIKGLDIRYFTTRSDIILGNTTLGDSSQTMRRDCQPVSAIRKAHNGLLATNMSVGGALRFRHAPDCSWNTPQNAKAFPVQVMEPLCLAGSTFGEDLDLTGVEVGSIDATNITVRRSLVLAREGLHTRWRRNPDLAGIALDLRDANLSNLVSCFLTSGEGRPGDWPSDRRLSGTLIGRLSVLECASGQIEDRVLEPSNGGHARLTAFLGSVSFQHERKLPYSLFASILEKNGYSSEAADLKFSAEAALTNHVSWFELPERWLKLFFGGYGVEPTYPASVAILFIVIGTLVLMISGEAKAHFASRRYPSRMPSLFRMLDMAVCSLDRLMPVFSLAKEHKDLAFKSDYWVRAYFFIHGFVGWLLASMVVLFLSEIIGLNP